MVMRLDKEKAGGSMQGDFNEKLEEYVATLIRQLQNGEHEDIKAFNETLHAADIALIMRELDERYRNIYFSLLGFEEASAVLEEMSAEAFYDLIKNLDKNLRMLILDFMPQDDIVDKLYDLPVSQKNQILAYLDIEDAKEVVELLDYKEDSAGGKMTKDYVTLMPSMTVDEAINQLRMTAPDAETIYYVFVTDEEETLLGVISLRELIVSKGNVLIEDVMNPHVIAVHENADQEEAARIVSKYNFLVVPVVDENQRLKGIITIDDIIDVIEEEATEDIFKFAGSSDLEDFEDDDSSLKRIVYAVRSRLPWLIITIFGGLLSGSVISKFSGALSMNATLALFMPMLAGMGGNVGTQSSTITVRSIALNYIEGWAVVKTILQEMAVGFIVGTVCSLIVAVVAYVTQGEMILSVIVGLSMFANIVTAATIGTLVPLTFKKIGIDPAVASAPFISTTVDITGLSIYFGLATYLMRVLMN